MYQHNTAAALMDRSGNAHDFKPEDLCKICDAISFEAIIDHPEQIPDGPYRSAPGLTVVELGTISEISAKPCRLCQYFVEFANWELMYLLENSFSALDDPCFSLQAFSIARHDRIWDVKPELDGVFFSIRVMGHLDFPRFSPPAELANYFVVTRGEDHENGKRLGVNWVPELVDFSLPLFWLDICKKHHKGCMPTDASKLPLLYVIDCVETIETGCLKVVQKPKSDQYAALSYVWGPPKEIVAPISNPEIKPLHAFKKLDDLPKVIQHGIMASLALKIQYLWVDRYCIDQEDSRLKHITIMNMDRIYSAAELTIIAEAGANDEGGLPGVQGSLRPSQKICRISDELFALSRKPEPTFSVQKSIWATRAWTFQEGLLSRRRLVFAPEQLYFNCGSLSCSEDFHIPEDVLFMSSLKQDIVGVFDHPSGYKDCILNIKAYTKRAMTYDEDSLNAFLGVLNYLKPTIGHVWGLPFDLSSKMELKRSFALSLLWFHPQAFASSKVTKRTAFPSWSWAGWAGQIGLYETSILAESLEDVEFAFETATGASILMEYGNTFEQRLRDLEMSPTRRLRITTHAFSLPVEQIGWQSQWQGFQFDLGDRGLCKSYLSSGPTDSQEFLNGMETTRYLVLYLGTSKMQSQCCLVVENYGEEYKRIGFLEIQVGSKDKLELSRSEAGLKTFTLI